MTQTENYRDGSAHVRTAKINKRNFNLTHKRMVICILVFKTLFVLLQLHRNFNEHLRKLLKALVLSYVVLYGGNQSTLWKITNLGQVTSTLPHAFDRYNYDVYVIICMLKT